MSGIFYGIFEIAFLLSSCYLLNKCICSPPINQMSEYYYIVPKEEYERLNDKQPLLAGATAAPPEYKAIADEAEQAEQAEQAVYNI